ncbi:MAG TPA: alpha/beta fold hydrolase [Euzebya sp.]|nr:alpha/beta fold hydrolase [Euzebya sp.]
MPSPCHDVVIVGGRVAGWTLATFLAGAGLSVAVVEQATSPSDAMSTHVIELEGVAVLSRMGVLEELLAASAAPLIGEVRTQIDGLEVIASLPGRPGDQAGFLSVRQTILDPVLHFGARAAGAVVLPDSTARSLLSEDGRVTGVEVEGPDGRRTLRARLVVGADGMSSWVGRAVGARRYHVRAVERFGAWAHYPEISGHPFVSYSVVGDGIGISAHGDTGLRMIGAVVPPGRWDAFRAHPAAELDAELRHFAWTASTLDSTAPLDGRVHLFRPPPTFMREAAGPGWVLAGDAGHFIDPTPGHGASGALRQSERLADHLIDAVAGPLHLDTATHRFWRWRDADVFETLHWAGDLGTGAMPGVVREALARKVRTRDQAPAPLQAYRRPLSAGVSGADVLSTAIAQIRSGRRSPADVVGEVRDLARIDRQRAAALRGVVHQAAPRSPPGSSTMFTTDVVCADGVRMPVLVGGPRHAGHTVVFVHGCPGSGAEFAGSAAAIADRARVLLPDLPGFGRADKPPGFAHTVGGYADALDAVVDRHRSGIVHLVAHDLGVLWALEWAVRNPDRIGSLTLVGCGVPLDARWHRLTGLWRTPVVGEAVMGLAGLGGAVVWRGLNHGRPRPIPDRDLRAMRRDADAATRQAVLRAHRAPERLADRVTRWLPVLRALHIPVLIVWGAHDRCIPVDQASRQLEVFAGAEVAVFDDSGHWPHLDDPHRFAATVVPFLRGVVG